MEIDATDKFRGMFWEVLNEGHSKIFEKIRNFLKDVIKVKNPSENLSYMIWEKYAFEENYDDLYHIAFCDVTETMVMQAIDFYIRSNLADHEIEDLAECLK